MKGKYLLNALAGMVLGLWTAAGSVGCLVTAFGLPVEQPERLVLWGAVLAVLCAGAYQWKHGGLLLLGLGVLGAAWVWHRGIPAEPFLSLVSRLTDVYDRAYGWGVFPAAEAPADIPLALAGGLVLLTTVRSVCRGTGAALPVLTAVLLFVPCVVVTDTVPDLPWLYLLGTGLALQILTGSARREDPFRGDRVAALAAVPLLLAGWALLALNPQDTYVNQSKALQQTLVDWTRELPSLMEHTAGAISGSTDTGRQVALDSLGRRIERKAMVMEVTSQKGGVLYLRGRDYDSYDGFGWTSTRNRSEDLTQAEAGTDTVTVRTRNVQGMLYLPYYPAEPMILTGGAVGNGENLREYTVSAGPLAEAAAASSPGAEAGWADEAAQEQNALLGRYRVIPSAAEAGLRSVLRELDLSGSVREQVAAIGAYVSSRAVYDLDPSRMPEDAADFACWFLKDAERGYCVHFATAATVLLRAAGIPARYVTGYMVTTEPGVPARVTGEQAHAWAEYYDPDLAGWVVLEATPAAETGETATEPSAVPETTAPVQTLPDRPRATEPDDTVPAGTRPTLPGAPDRGEAPDLSGLASIAGWLGAFALLAALAEGQRRLRLALRHRHRDTSNARALALWRETVLLAKLLGQEPPRELHRLAQKAKFSQHTLTGEELDRFAAFLAEARQSLRARPWYLRLIFRYLYAAY